MDATHSVQMLGALNSSTGGNRLHVSAIARAAVAVGMTVYLSKPTQTQMRHYVMVQICCRLNIWKSYLKHY